MNHGNRKRTKLRNLSPLGTILRDEHLRLATGGYGVLVTSKCIWRRGPNGGGYDDFFPDELIDA